MFKNMFTPQADIYLKRMLVSWSKNIIFIIKKNITNYLNGVFFYSTQTIFFSFIKGNSNLKAYTFSMMQFN